MPEFRSRKNNVDASGFVAARRMVAWSIVSHCPAFRMTPAWYRTEKLSTARGLTSSAIFVVALREKLRAQNDSVGSLEYQISHIPASHVIVHHIMYRFVDGTDRHIRRRAFPSVQVGLFPLKLFLGVTYKFVLLQD